MFSLAGIARLRVDSNWLDDFSERVPLKGATTRIDEVMGGMSNLVYVFDTGREDGIRDPEVLRAIERVQREAEQHDFLVKKAYSIVDIVKDLNQSFHDGDPAYYAIPDDRALVSQLLLLYETSGGDEVEEWATTDFSRANLELRLRIAPISHTDELVQAARSLPRRPPDPRRRGAAHRHRRALARAARLHRVEPDRELPVRVRADRRDDVLHLRLVQDRAPLDGARTSGRSCSR